MFDDEFDGSGGSLPNTSKWTITTGGHWAGNEVECYTADPANVALDGSGHLVLTARYGASCDGRGYSSGRIETRDKEAWTYGYFEIRARVPVGAGALPAIWMLGPNAVTNWPRSGETDILETVADYPKTVHTNVHGIDQNGNAWEPGWDGPNKSTVYGGSSLDDGFHTYALDWAPGVMKFYFDNTVVRVLRQSDTPVWLWNKPFYLLLNLGIGVVAGVTQQPNPSAYPQSMAVDYVRIYSSKP